MYDEGVEDEHRLASADYAGATTTNHPGDRMTIEDDADAYEQRDHEAEAMERRYKRMMGHYLHEISTQAHNRAQMTEDELFYDGEQWAAEDAEAMRRRGQEPISYNVVKTSLDWLFGTERRTRVDHKILPRREDGADAAEKKSQILKYINDTNRAQFSVSRAFQDAGKVGVGWIESGLQSEDEGEPIYERYESWRNMLWDSTAVEPDLKDARYVFRSKWVDEDVAVALFPEKKHTIARAASNTYDAGTFSDLHGDDAMDEQEEFATDNSSLDVDYDQHRRRVRLIEAWYKSPENVERMRGGDFSGEIFDPYSHGHTMEIAMGRASVRRTISMRMRVMIFTSAGPIYDARSPYRHNRFPFTAIWGYRRGSDGQPYGMIRNMKAMQRDVNKRASKALAIISSNKIVMDDGAVDNLDELAEEAARPDGVIVKKPGKHLEFHTDRGLDNAHLEMMSRTIALMQSVSGVTDENLGRQTNASSGKAITARQDQGSLATSALFDNLRYARQVHGEKVLSLTEQFMTDEKTFRITNMRGSPSYVTVNDGMPENDIVATKADFIISEDAWDATLRQSKAAELQELLTQLAQVSPEIVMATLDLLVETMDVPNGDEIVKRIRQITGQMDPDADPNNPDEETQELMAQKQAEAEKQQAMEQLQMAKEQAETEKTSAQAQEIQAKTGKLGIEAQKLLDAIPGEDLETKRRALELASEMLGQRESVSVADRLLSEAGMSFDRPPAGAQPPASQPTPMQ